MCFTHGVHLLVEHPVDVVITVHEVKRAVDLTHAPQQISGESDKEFLFMFTHAPSDMFTNVRVV